VSNLATDAGALTPAIPLGIILPHQYGARGSKKAEERPVVTGAKFGVFDMADHVVPHFQNDAGVSVIEIGATEFMCVGARPPFDHPHVFLDMGDDREIICPYCSTLFRHAKDLAAGDSRPPECALKDKAA
jgi:uncharacterized Zn-finger protein